jgi:predicted PurR-regulated permease PerM
MSARGRLIFWLVFLGVLVFALTTLREVMLPFVAGLAIAYFLDPLVDRFEKFGLSRTLSTSIVLLLFFVAAIGVLLLIAPVLQSQIAKLVEAAPGYIEKLRQVFAPVLSEIAEIAGNDPFADLPSIAGKLARIVSDLLGRVVSGGIAIANLLSLLFITPVVAFYLLRDWDRMIAKIDGWLPKAQAAVIRLQAREVDRTLAGFVRGQGTVCLCLGIFYAITLSLAGLQFGLVIGVFSGLISFIPFVGALLGGAVSIGLALLQFDDLTWVGVVFAIFVVGQILEGNFLTPRLVGEAVGLHPVWIIFALLAGGALFGFLGVLVAVPAIAVIGVLARFALAQYLESQLHLTSTQAPPVAVNADGDQEIKPPVNKPADE